MSSLLCAGRLLALSAVVLAGCGPVERGAAQQSARLYVANAHDGTVSLVSPAGGSWLPAATAAPAAPLVWQIAAGRGGTRLLTLGGGSTHGGQVTLTGRDEGGWWTRRVDLDPRAAATLLGGDGDSYALVAYGEGTAHTRAPASACALALVDLADGAVAARATVCAPGETVTALQLRPAVGRSAGVHATVGVWSRPTGGRVAVGDPMTGTTLLTAVVPGIPTAILMEEEVLHVWLAEPPAEPWGGLADADLAAPGSVLTLSQSSLDAEALVRLAEPVTTPALAPRRGPRRGPGVAYGLADARRSLVSVDLATGGLRRLATLPAAGASVVVTDSKVFVAIRERDSLAVYDLARSVSLPSIRTGRGPLALALAG